MTEHRNPPMPADEMRDQPDLVRQQRDRAEGRVLELEAELERLRDATVIVECDDPEHEDRDELRVRVAELERDARDVVDAS